MPDSVKKLIILGIVFSVLVTIGFVFAGIALYNLWKPAVVSQQQLENNLEKTFANLQTIARAQEEYKKTDWDGDGKKLYAKYYIHLWTSVSKASDPIKVGLIPKKLAFAFEAARTVNGYYFVDLHDIKIGDSQLRPLDYSKQWAVLASSPNENLNEVTYLLADISGIYAKKAKYIPLEYIENPTSQGWTKIDSPEQLKNFR
jgi:hypothetical protein